jgi:WD40 repeat protein
VAGGQEGVARWDGHQWLPLPLPFPGAGALNHIQAVAFTQAGDLIVGGSFSPTFGTVEASVLRWDGHVWQVIGCTSHTFVQSLALRRDQLVVGTGSTSMVHSFSQNSGSVVRMQANGGERQSQTFNSYVQAVAVAPNGDIIAGGSFTDYLVRWNGKSWQRIGSGLQGEVRAVAVAPNGDIIAGGDFTATGDASQSLALWGIYQN